MRIRVMLVAIAALLMIASQLPAQETTIYVAPGGDDRAAGTEGAPFATPQRARDEIRRLRQLGLPAGGVRIVLRGGTYSLRQPLELTPEDSGTADSPIIWATYPGERPVLSGGWRIEGLRRNPDGSWSTTIPAARNHGWVFRQLFIDGRRYIPARSPNEGQFLAVSGVPLEDGALARDRFVFEPGDLEPWPHLSDVEVRVYFSWNAGSFPLQSVDPEARIAILGGPAAWSIPKPGMSVAPYIVQNHPGACDAPGEWQLDRITGELHIIPFADEDLDVAEVIAPAMERLVVAQGTPDDGRYVEHVRFEGISFQHAAWVLPPEGFSVPQAASTLGAALEFHGARNIAISGCEVAHVGRYGIWFGLDCSDNLVERTHLHDLGGGGVKLGTPDRPQVFERMAHHNRIDNNFIHDGGHVHPGATGIYMAYGRNNTISHNEVSDLRYTGISLGWTWDIYRSGTRENIVEYNHVHDVMRLLEDGGGIYSLGLTPGSIIRNNLVHHVGQTHGVGHGIYLDGGSAGLLVEDNICHDCGAGGIRQQHGTSCLTVLNNISAFCGFGLGIDSERTNIFQYNIVYLDGEATPFRFVPEWQSYNKIIDYNLYWHAQEREMKFLGFTWDEWREKEGIEDIWYTPRMDAHSRIADPLFVDAAARDFRLQPDSPALAMGFRPIDIDAIGLYGDPQWTSLPAEHPPQPLTPNEAAPPGMLLVVDDFEDTSVGAKPAYAALVEAPDEGAVIFVSDERASSGAHSLKFVDTAEAPIYYHPHMYYSPRLIGDMRVRMTFDLYREPGAMLWTEWRNTPGYAKLGPCIYIEADGHLLFQERRPSEVYLSDGQWLHFEIEAGLGALANAQWSLRITDGGGEVLFEDPMLPCDPEFKRILWLGFVSNGMAPAVMYLDNIVMTRVE